MKPENGHFLPHLYDANYKPKETSAVITSALSFTVAKASYVHNLLRISYQYITLVFTSTHSFLFRYFAYTSFLVIEHFIFPGTILTQSATCKKQTVNQ